MTIIQKPIIQLILINILEEDSPENLLKKLTLS